MSGALGRGKKPPPFCPSCGYSLNDITAEVCPECGGRLDRSVFAYTLEHARRLHTGVSIAEFSTIVAIVGTIPAQLVLGVLNPFTGFTTGAQNALLSLYNLAVSAALCFGWWLFSAAHPVEELRGPDWRRLLLRAAVVVKLVIALTDCLLTLGAAHIPLVPPFVTRGLAWGGSLTLFVVAAAAIVYCRAIARRLGVYRLWRDGRVQLIFLAWVAGIGLVYAMLTGLSHVYQVGRPGLAGLLIGLPTFLASCVWYVLYIAMVDRTRRVVLNVIILHWRAEEAQPHPEDPAAG